MTKGVVTKKILFRPILLLVLFLLVALGSAGYFFSQYKKTKEELSQIKENPQQLAQLEAAQLVEKVGKLVVLPDETPTIATVTDLELVKDRPFFANAKNGDKVLIFTNAKKAILYDPISNRVVNIAPLTIGDQDQQVQLTPTKETPTPSIETPTPTQAEELRFLLRNGTNKVGLTQVYERELIKALPNALVVDRENAANKDYQETVLIDVSGEKEKQAEQIAKTLGISVISLPKDEEKPVDVDFLVVVGADKKNL